jgi:hypothetical protein
MGSRLVGRTLNDRAHPWALVGGLAVPVRVEPSFTRDIDLAVSVPDDRAAERLVADLTAAGFALRLSFEQHALGRLAAVRLLLPGEPNRESSPTSACLVWTASHCAANCAAIQGDRSLSRALCSLERRQASRTGRGGAGCRVFTRAALVPSSERRTRSACSSISRFVAQEQG